MLQLCSKVKLHYRPVRTMNLIRLVWTQFINHAISSSDLAKVAKRANVGKTGGKDTYSGVFNALFIPDHL